MIWISKKPSSQKAFTLIELLIVIGILAILATITLLVINPAQLVKQSRDSNRLTEINQINKALLLFQSFGGSSMGTHTKVYVSIPSSQSDCSDLGLPALGGGYTYACSTSASYRNTDGTGWIPVNFSSVQSSAGSLFSNLPIDPINTVANGYYYTYIPGSWALSATMESEKYLASSAVNDGGQVSARFELGNEIALNANLGSDGGTCSATGGTITQVSGYCIHTFTSSGTFTVTQAGNVQVLVVAGGGSGGGGNYHGGGGGGGGVVYNSLYAVTAGSMSVVVGNGGAAVSGVSVGNNGNNSSFGTITAIGGGGGGNWSSGIGKAGGSGGGGHGGNVNNYANTPGTGSQGYNGGVGFDDIYNLALGAGGGGGAGGPGQDGASLKAGDGGIGYTSSISGVSTAYAGGGGGGAYQGTAGVGNDGGGNGARSDSSPYDATSGTANTGGGGGGSERGGTTISGAGGSGIVIIRY